MSIWDWGIMDDLFCSLVASIENGIDSFDGQLRLVSLNLVIPLLLIVLSCLVKIFVLGRSLREIDGFLDVNWLVCIIVITAILQARILLDSGLGGRVCRLLAEEPSVETLQLGMIIWMLVVVILKFFSVLFFTKCNKIWSEKRAGRAISGGHMFRCCFWGSTSYAISIVELVLTCVLLGR
jgi:hypothetical protein